ncbi:SWIM zinc finger family protein [Actinoplanes sp. TBRC 11911]|uniref:SWIM zinc finger family protein n=1 Tax=Actinoplanes sp. TBRC 11911 TaxID=2729386 RepID=UPI00145F1BD6|nr:SWIM zinc finger family protein [Actinoplanes sp. TBRC 11911]NMO49836.1 SWIM zinc finger family protein [Actinoplanes sp. TBRC 11911]
MATAAYTYLGPSIMDQALTLQTSGGPAANPRFFAGFLTMPAATSAGLLAVAEVARTRYFQPTGRSSLDPVVTAGADRLRFESFSGCCGVYARLDVLPAGLDGAIAAHGTTNVDVNAPLQRALTRVGRADPLRLSVGPDDVTVSTFDGAIVERKVPLPSRWLRGFAEAQVITAGFDPRAELGVPQARALLTRLPPGDRSVLWAVPSGNGLRITSRPVAGAICLPGAGRLVALKPFLRYAVGMRIYGPAVRAGSSPMASTWELITPELRLSLTLSPEPSRGFSGEGAALESLAADEATDDADLISALLSWDPTIDVDALARESGLGAARVRDALAQLGTAGRVGYDVAEAGYFHRALPYAADAVTRLNPRLAGAHALVDAGAVTLGGEVSTVLSGDQTYRVRAAGDVLSCTCPWWAKYRGDRGPCKHALAVRMIRAAAAVEVPA